jgi:transposase
MLGMRPTSIDLRKRIVTARMKDRQSMGQIAERFGIAKGTVQNIIERYRDAGTVNPKPQNAGRKPAFCGALLKRLERDVLDRPDATLLQLRDHVGLAVSLATVYNTLRRMGFTLKKSPCAPRNNIGLTSSNSAASGRKRLRALNPHASSSSMKPAQRRA